MKLVQFGHTEGISKAQIKITFLNNFFIINLEQIQYKMFHIIQVYRQLLDAVQKENQTKVQKREQHQQMDWIDRVKVKCIF